MQRKRKLDDDNYQPEKRPKISQERVSNHDAPLSVQPQDLDADLESQQLRIFFDAFFGNKPATVSSSPANMMPAQHVPTDFMVAIPEVLDAEDIASISDATHDYLDDNYFDVGPFIAPAYKNVFEGAPILFADDFEEAATLFSKETIAAPSSIDIFGAAIPAVVKPAVPKRQAKPAIVKPLVQPEIIVAQAMDMSAQTSSEAMRTQLANVLLGAQVPLNDKLMNLAQTLFVTKPANASNTIATPASPVTDKLSKITFHSLNLTYYYCFVADLKAQGYTNESFEALLKSSHKAMKKKRMNEAGHFTKPVLIENTLLQIHAALIRDLYQYYEAPRNFIQYTLLKYGEHNVMRRLLGRIENNAHIRAKTGESIESLLKEAEARHCPPKTNGPSAGSN